ncbi:MAG TPA: carboxy terminal-processing peptidase [Polyangiaceae bacterium]|jgi:carboxyl-terminal processing protease|nr:carboxy terminal-processing peptidase [Polyangiaceae bacterium]
MNRSLKIATPLTALGMVLALAATGFGGRPATAAPDPHATDANITKVTTALLEHSQFARHPFDDALAGTLLDRYLDALDPARSLFLQSDVDEFAAYRASLPQAIRDSGDTAAPRAIFRRYLQRLAQQEAYVAGQLRTTTFDFTGHDVYSYDREHAAHPRDLATAQELWRQQLRAEYLQEKLGDKRVDPIAGTLTNRHAQQLRTMQSLSDDEVLEIYLDTLAHVYDPHSDYLGHEQMESLSIAMDLSLSGIGATLENEDGYCKIHELTPGGPAAKGGVLKPGDRIISVAQAGKPPVDVVNMPLSRTVDLIRGPKGSTVTLRVIPAGAADGAPPQTASLVRDQVKLDDQAARARIEDRPSDKGGTMRLGVIELPSFYAGMAGQGGAERRSATADVAKLLRKLEAEHVRGVVLDLRGNGGGSLAEAISMTGLFIRTGPVVQTRDPAGNVEVGADDDPSIVYGGPLVLLTNRFSASATEILAGALQDYGRAVVVGDPSTFGKGTVQTIVPLAHVMDEVHLGHAFDPGALKVTTNKFYRPSGASTQLRGVASDIVLPSNSDLADVSEASLKDPLPWDVVPPAAYDRLQQVKPYLDALRENSARRVEGEKDFGDLADDAARLGKSMAAKSVSLNEADRRQELAQAKARHEEREQEERTKWAATPTIYEITLDNASSPGLPPAATATNDAAGANRSTAPHGPDDKDEAALGRPPKHDVVLNETVRILSDYVDLLGRPVPSLRSQKAS